jgi:hypothetical protein
MVLQIFPDTSFWIFCLRRLNTHCNIRHIEFNTGYFSLHCNNTNGYRQIFLSQLRSRNKRDKNFVQKKAFYTSFVFKYNSKHFRLLINNVIQNEELQICTLYKKC